MERIKGTIDQVTGQKDQTPETVPSTHRQHTITDSFASSIRTITTHSNHHRHRIIHPISFQIFIFHPVLLLPVTRVCWWVMRSGISCEETM
jgi:hypothetical protein